MPACRDCGTDLPGRRRVCDACKAATRKAKVEQPTPEPEPDDEATAGPPPAPAGLHRRGRELWHAIGEQPGTAGGELALEACRTADRLEELDRIVAGKGVLQLMKFRLNPDWWDEDGDQHVTVTVGFQSVLTEARLQQGAFKDLMKDLRTLQAGKPAGARKGQNPAPSPTPPPAANPVDQLAQRRQQRGEKSS